MINTEPEPVKINQFLDDDGKIIQLPRKQSVRLAVLKYLTEKFKPHCVYSEHEVNEICNRWNTFGDYFILRRELIDNDLLNRDRDGSRYWRPSEKTPLIN